MTLWCCACSVRPKCQERALLRMPWAEREELLQFATCNSDLGHATLSWFLAWQVVIAVVDRAGDVAATARELLVRVPRADLISWSGSLVVPDSDLQSHHTHF